MVYTPKQRRLPKKYTSRCTRYPNLDQLQNGDLEVHSQHLYHKNAVAAGRDFLKNLHSPQSDVYNLINEDHRSQSQENRKRLMPIVKTIILCGRQNIPLRGHRDDGPLLTESDPVRNEGNFRALLRFRVESGDTILENHLKTASSAATYISKTVQDQLIDCCRVEIQKKILERVTDAVFYSVEFDETPDLSGKAQISLIIRYLDFSSGKPCVREDFVDFIDAFVELSKGVVEKDEDSGTEAIPSTSAHGEYEDGIADEELSLTGVALGNVVLLAMKKLNLRLENCTSIGTDACAVNLSDKCGAVNEIRKEATNAVMVPCFSHKLNSSLMKSSNVQSIEKVSSIIREVTKFFKNSHPKRATALAKTLGHKLIHLCETRWVERHDAVLQFATNLGMIVEALTKVSNWKNRETADKATVLISALCSFDFIIGLFSLCDVLSLTRPLSVTLQKEDMDLGKASENLESLLEALDNQRQEAEEKFKQIYVDAKNMAEELNVEVKKPRTCGKQTKRENHDVNNCEDYYRVSMYIPLLDNFIEDLKTRFSQEVLDGFQLGSLLPKNVKNLKSNEITDLINCLIGRFGDLLKDNRKLQYLRLKGEMNHWQLHWRRKATQNSQNNTALPASALETLESCDKDVYPMIHALLRIFCTICVTNASAERSFSTLRRLKTWLRTTMLEKRLIGLALLHIHQDIEVKPEEIIERFAKLGSHRMVI